MSDEFLNLKLRLENWGRTYQSAKRARSASPLFQVMRALGYQVEVVDAGLNAIDYEDAKRVDEAYYSLPLGSAERLYIGVYYCTNCRSPRDFCQKTKFPHHLFNELEHQSLKLMAGLLNDDEQAN